MDVMQCFRAYQTEIHRLAVELLGLTHDAAHRYVYEGAWENAFELGYTPVLAIQDAMNDGCPGDCA